MSASLHKARLIALLAMTVAPAAALAQEDVSSFVAVVNQAGRVELTWTNPANLQGVVIVRRLGTAPTYVPGGRNAAPPPYGHTPESGTVVVAPVGTPGVALTAHGAGSFIDNGAVGPALVQGARYHYRIHTARRRGNSNNYDYSPGIVPTAQGLSVWPLGASSAPLQWCYSVGMPNFARPVVQSGVRAMTVGNLGALTSNRVSDGVETWRPLPLGGLVQARPVYSTLFAGAGGQPHIFTGDQAGSVYRINATTRTEVWRRNSQQVFNVPAGTMMPIQASPVAQFAGVSGATAPQDLVFFGTRTGGTNNRVAALRNDGNTVWLYPAAGALGDITGEMYVDYANNRLWIPTTSATSPLHVVSSINGAQVAGPTGMPSAIGPVARGIVQGDVVRDANGTVVDTMVLVPANSGIWAFRRDTLQYLWHVPLPSAPTAHVLPIQGGFVVGFGTTVRRYRFPTGDSAQTPVQMGPDVTLNGSPSSLRLVGSQFVFTAGNTLYQVDGFMTIQGQFTMPGDGALSPPQEDGPSRVVVGTADGRVCAVSLPLPAVGGTP